ncbi:hypothetical protein [Candidatus Uabimicrobium sp. HlEnr_7]|uniref:hypothetical protein n=1 Tax=Candidatus Uabimicrobium helgolandensis TaxID=3095367 RepID=UPI0035562E03
MDPWVKPAREYNVNFPVELGEQERMPFYIDMGASAVFRQNSSNTGSADQNTTLLDD